MMWWIGAGIALLALLLFSGGIVFFFACIRKKEHAWLDPQALKGTTYEKYADHMRQADRWLKAHNAQQVSVRSNDGLELHALWIPAENARGTILLAHGYRSTRLLDFGMVYSLYHNLGINLLVPEQRCHGSSEGKFITFGVKESDDMLAWLQMHNQQFGAVPVILSGLSMGASTMLYLADQQLPENVKGIIADCGFTSPKEIIGKVFRQVTHLPAGPFLFAADLFARLFAGFSLSQKDTRKALQNTKLPVLLVHGLADDFVPSFMTQQAYDACNSEKQLLMVPEAGHGTAFLKAKEEYVNLVVHFLKENVDGKS